MYIVKDGRCGGEGSGVGTRGRRIIIIVITIINASGDDGKSIDNRRAEYCW